MKVRVLLALAAASFLCSCDMFVGTGKGPYGTGNGLPRRKIITDKETRKSVKILKIDDSTLPNGKMKAEVTLVNRDKNNPCKFFYVFIWYTKAGKKIAPPPNRRVEVFLTSGEKQTITSVAPKADCVDFQVELSASPLIGDATGGS